MKIIHTVIGECQHDGKTSREVDEIDALRRGRHRDGLVIDTPKNNQVIDTLYHVKIQNLHYNFRPNVFACEGILIR